MHNRAAFQQGRASCIAQQGGGGQGGTYRPALGIVLEGSMEQGGNRGSSGPSLRSLETAMSALHGLREAREACKLRGICLPLATWGMHHDGARLQPLMTAGLLYDACS